MYDWLVIVPPLLVVICALITRHMILSFFIGIASAALIATHGNLHISVALVATRLTQSAGTDSSLCIFIFLACVGILLILLQHSGGAQAFQNVAQRNVKNKKSTEIASLLLSPFFFIDDYFSALTVGSVMRPLANLHHVHPIKLAFLVTAMAQPIVILSPLSSWVGQIIMQLKEVGVTKTETALVAADPYYVFLKTIPFMFYALLLIFGTWYIVLRRISYGPMAYFEKQSLPIQSHTIVNKKIGSLFDFIFPLIVLITVVFVAIPITGDLSWFGGRNSIIEAFKNSSISHALLAGGITSVIISFFFLFIRRKIALKEIGSVVKEGAMLMLPSIFMLICAWTLSLMLKQDLKTGDYIATIFISFISVSFFPLLCFIGSACVAVMLGSAWATMGLMFPIILPMLKTMLSLPINAPLETIPLLLPVIGAALSGCIMGTHLSLISDNPIMASASTGANHFDLVKAMSWYIVPVAISCSAAYCILGLSVTALGPTHAIILALFTGIILTVLLLETAQRLFRRTNHENDKNYKSH